MGIVLACLIFGLAIAIERIIYLNLATTNTQKLTNDIEAALGISQLSRLDKFVMKRNKISLLYKYYLDKKNHY